MTVPVAVVPMGEDCAAALAEALSMLGGIDALNTPGRDVTLKVGIFDPRSSHHSSPGVVRAIAGAFDRAPLVRLVESDNYCGSALDRLKICYGELFDDRIIPTSLSGDPQARIVRAGGEEMPLGSALFKPNVFVSTHILRTFAKGSILKNLFGCTPMVKKARFHKDAVYAPLLADIFEAAGGIDLAVVDGSFLLSDATEKRVPAGLLIVGKDAVAVETVSAAIAGLKPEKVPVIQEFARRGLGVGEMSGIEIVGLSKEEFAGLKRLPKELKAWVKAQPRKPGISGTIDQLIEEGWMDRLRCLPEVAGELKDRGVTAKEAVVETTLKRRVGKTLERFRDGEAWAYRKRKG